MTARTRAIVLGALVLVAIAVLELGDRPAAPRHVAPPSTPAATAAPAPTAVFVPEPVTPAQIATQDRLSATQAAAERRATAARRLLDHLPLTLAGTRLDIAGLTADGQKTVLELRAGPRGAAFAMTVYRQALATYGDTGGAYQLRTLP